jgi:hypothetical protein
MRRATDVLYALRSLNSGARNIYGVARLLIQQGIPFRTLLPLNSVASSYPLSSIVKVIPFRLIDYKFKPHDYAAYVRERDAILAQPRGRAALLHGGIVWRLAKESLSLDAALEGPSRMVTVHRVGYCVDDHEPTRQFWDDELTEDELMLICGLHLCYTGKYYWLLCFLLWPLIVVAGSSYQKAFKSWWPLSTTWNDVGCGSNWGRWTEQNEQWFQDRLRKIQDGTAQPLPANKWRDLLRGMKEVRHIKANVEKFSGEYLEARRSSGGRWTPSFLSTSMYLM